LGAVREYRRVVSDVLKLDRWVIAITLTHERHMKFLPSAPNLMESADHPDPAFPARRGELVAQTSNGQSEALH